MKNQLKPMVMKNKLPAVRPQVQPEAPLPEWAKITINDYTGEPISDKKRDQIVRAILARIDEFVKC